MYSNRVDVPLAQSSTPTGVTTPVHMRHNTLGAPEDRCSSAGPAQQGGLILLTDLGARVFFDLGNEDSQDGKDWELMTSVTGRTIPAPPADLQLQIKACQSLVKSRGGYWVQYSLTSPSVTCTMGQIALSAFS